MALAVHLCGKDSAVVLIRTTLTCPRRIVSSAEGVALLLRGFPPPALRVADNAPYAKFSQPDERDEPRTRTHERMGQPSPKCCMSVIRGLQ